MIKLCATVVAVLGLAFLLAGAYAHDWVSFVCGAIGLIAALTLATHEPGE